VHFAWFSPTLLATSPSISSAVPLVSSVREGVASYHAVLFVPAESRIQHVGDLAGTHVAWVAETSASGYLFPRLSLERHGLDPHTLFASERFYQSYDAAARAVFDGAADVGAAFAVFEHGDPKATLLRSGFEKSANGRAVRVIDVSGPIPADVIVASRGVPSEMRAAAAAALRHLCEDAASRQFVRALFGVDRFELCGHGVLQSLRALAPLAAASHR
jgi:phosphonate transport system substrate-binding protein